jgi:hypothetical protein
VKSVAALFLVLALPAFGFDANLLTENKTRPTSFAGVPWGTDRNDAVRILGARAGAVAPEELPADQSRVELTGGNFSGQAAEKWTLEFANRKLFAATVVLKADGAARTRFRDLKQMLVAKYGSPSREGKPPIAIGAEKKDRLAQQRLAPDQKLFGNTAAWKFTPTLADKEPKTIELILATAGGILATDESQLVVMMRYSNEAFAPQTGAGKSATPAKPAGPNDL